MICIVGDTCQTRALQSSSAAAAQNPQERAGSQRRHQSINKMPSTPISRAQTSWNSLAARSCLQTKQTACKCLPPCWQVRLSDHGAGWKAFFSLLLGSIPFLSLSIFYKQSVVFFFVFFCKNTNKFFLLLMPYVFNLWRKSRLLVAYFQCWIHLLDIVTFQSWPACVRMCMCVCESLLI